MVWSVNRWALMWLMHMHMTTKGRVQSRWPPQWSLRPATSRSQTPKRGFSIQRRRCGSKTTSHGLFQFQIAIGLFCKFGNSQGARIWPPLANDNPMNHFYTKICPYSLALGPASLDNIITRLMKNKNKFNENYMFAVYRYLHDKGATCKSCYDMTWKLDIVLQPIQVSGMCLKFLTFRT